MNRNRQGLSDDHRSVCAIRTTVRDRDYGAPPTGTDHLKMALVFLERRPKEQMLQVRSPKEQVSDLTQVRLNPVPISCWRRALFPSP